MTTKPTLSPDDAMRAAEYVLHLMPSADRKEFETTIAWDATVRDEVLFWNEHLAALSEETAPVAPPPGAKSALMDRVFADIGHSASLKSRLRLWQAAFAALAVAAVAAFVLLPGVQLPSFGSDPAPAAETGALLTGDIAASDASLRVIAVYQPTSNELKLNRTAGAAPSTRALELWAIVGEDPPVSLGVLPEESQTTIIVPEALRANFDLATLAISDEPEGGSPTGTPTGAVLAAGVLAAF